MSGRPTSIEGGIRYTPEPVPGQRPVTQQYVVTWRSADETHTVRSVPVWYHQGLDRPTFAWFRHHVELEMLRHPPA